MLAEKAAALVSMEQLEKVYPNGTIAVQGVDLEAGAGEFICFVGPSGCGKSTIFKMIAGLEQPTGGHLEIFGKNPDDARKQNEIAFVFQEHTLLPWSTVEANVMLPLALRKVPKPERREAAHRALRLVGLSDYVKALPRELSGGMKMRVSIARALVSRPKLLLMDEPFGALDAITRDQMNIELQRIWMSTRNTVLFVTHGIAEAVFLGDEVMVFSPRPGRIARTLRIDLPRPRPLSIRETKAFGDYVAEIRDLFQQMGIFKERDNAPASGNLMEGKA